MTVALAETFCISQKNLTVFWPALWFLQLEWIPSRLSSIDESAADGDVAIDLNKTVIGIYAG